MSDSVLPPSMVTVLMGGSWLMKSQGRTVQCHWKSNDVVAGTLRPASTSRENTIWPEDEFQSVMGKVREVLINKTGQENVYFW